MKQKTKQIIIGNDWDKILEQEFSKKYWIELQNFLQLETCIVFPPEQQRYRALSETSFEKTKVVIVGQDPYIKKHQAHGFAFSVNDGVPIPPSLRNIFKEINSDLNKNIEQKSGNLERWANQGVLLLNSVLTVRENESSSHKKRGWETFTDKIIEKICAKNDPVVFLLWGKQAQEKQKNIFGENKLVLCAAHPSPLAGGAFFGCKHFSKTNDFLRKNNVEEICW